MMPNLYKVEKLANYVQQQESILLAIFPGGTPRQDSGVTVEGVRVDVYPGGASGFNYIRGVHLSVTYRGYKEKPIARRVAINKYGMLDLDKVQEKLAELQLIARSKHEALEEVKRRKAASHERERALKTEIGLSGPPLMELWERSDGGYYLVLDKLTPDQVRAVGAALREQP